MCGVRVFKKFRLESVIIENTYRGVMLGELIVISHLLLEINDVARIVGIPEGQRHTVSELQPERNVPPPSRRRKPADDVAICGCPLVTSARVGRRGRRSEMSGVLFATGTCVGHGDS